MDSGQRQTVARVLPGNHKVVLINCECEIITAVPAAAFLLDLAGSRIIYDIHYTARDCSARARAQFSAWLGVGGVSGGERYSSYWPMISYH